jgi:hypothetical protein
MRRSTLIAIWSSGVIAWVLMCSGGWYAATRDDYATLNAATACFAAQPPPQSTPCSGLRPSDIHRVKAAIDRKAAISRLAGTFGAVAALTVLILSRRSSPIRQP